MDHGTLHMGYGVGQGGDVNVPKELRSRDLKSRRDNEWLTQYVMAFMFRWNSKPQLLKAVGKLAKKASRQRDGQKRRLFSRNWFVELAGLLCSTQKMLKPMAKMGRFVHPCCDDEVKILQNAALAIEPSFRTDEISQGR